MSLTIPTKWADTIVTNQSRLSKANFTTLTIARFFFKDARLSIQDEFATTEFQKKSFDVYNFFVICAHFALKCDLPRIFLGMMMHKLEILSKSYFRASDIEAVLTDHPPSTTRFSRNWHMCTHATLIKLIYNLQENHIPTEVLWQGQVSAKKHCAKVMWILGRKNIYAFSARSPIFLMFIAHSYHCWSHSTSGRRGCKFWSRLSFWNHESPNNSFNANSKLL